MLPMLEGFAESCVAEGAVTRAEADGWLAGQRERAGNDRLFLAVPMFVASGTR